MWKLDVNIVFCITALFQIPNYPKNVVSFVVYKLSVDKLYNHIVSHIEKLIKHFCV